MVKIIPTVYTVQSLLLLVHHTKYSIISLFGLQPYSRWFSLSCLKSVIHKALLDQYEFKVKPLNKVCVNISAVSVGV